MAARLRSIDTMGDLKSQIDKLMKRYKKMCDHLKDYRGVGQYEGLEYVGVCYESESCVPNVPKLKKKFGADWRKYVTVTPYTAVRIERKGARKRSAVKRSSP